MTDMDGIARRDLERLSAFLDGELSSAEAEKLGARLATDKQLSGTLEALRATSEAVRSLPEVSPPRSFALTEEIVRPRRAYPLLQLSTAVAALGFVLVVGADLLLSSSGSSALKVPDQAFFAADRLAPEAEEQLAAPAPAEAPALEGEEAERELAAAAEPEADSVGDAEDGFARGPLGSGESAAGGELAADEREAAAGEELAEAEREAAAEEGFTAEGALKAEAEQEPSAEESIVGRDLSEDEPLPPLGPLRAIEIGLAAVVIVLVGLTLWVRQRG